jgi:hypothetical protein
LIAAVGLPQPQRSQFGGITAQAWQLFRVSDLSESVLGYLGKLTMMPFEGSCRVSRLPSCTSWLREVAERSAAVQDVRRIWG